MSKKRNPTLQGEIVMKYLGEYPQWFPKASLARIILKENPHTFDDDSNVRWLIRYYTGKAGEANRQIIKSTGNGSIETIIRKSSPFAEPPETWAEEKKVFQLPTGIKKWGFVADMQAPFHCPRAIDICFNYLHKIGIKGLFINGDLVDFFQLSEFEKDPRVRKFDDEYENVLELLGYIKQSFPTIPIYYNLDANHEYRYERYMRKKAPELLGLKLFELEDLLMLDNFGIKYIKGYDHVKMGKLPIVHGDTVFRRGSGVSPARTLLLRTKVSCIASHVHRTSEYTDKNFDGEMSTCWTTGMLMHPNVDYCRHVDQYNQGFADIELDNALDYEVHNKKIYKGKVF